MASCIAARSAQRAAARISERSRSSLDVSLWTGTVNAHRRDRASTVVSALILNGGDERYLRKRSLPQPFGIAFANAHPHRCDPCFGTASAETLVQKQRSTLIAKIGRSGGVCVMLIHSPSTAATG